jgi:hypothetical protein
MERMSVALMKEILEGYRPYKPEKVPPKVPVAEALRPRTVSKMSGSRDALAGPPVH